MIVSFDHKGLKRLFCKSLKNESKSQEKQTDTETKIRKVLDTLNAIKSLDEIPKSYGLHNLKGKLKGFYAIKVNKNYRIIFQVSDKGIEHIDYLDYH